MKTPRELAKEFYLRDTYPKICDRLSPEGQSLIREEILTAFCLGHKIAKTFFIKEIDSLKQEVDLLTLEVQSFTK